MQVGSKILQLGSISFLRLRQQIKYNHHLVNQNQPMRARKLALQSFMESMNPTKTLLQRQESLPWEVTTSLSYLNSRFLVLFSLLKTLAFRRKSFAIANPINNVSSTRATIGVAHLSRTKIMMILTHRIPIGRGLTTAYLPLLPRVKKCSLSLNHQRWQMRQEIYSNRNLGRVCNLTLQTGSIIPDLIPRTKPIFSFSRLPKWFQHLRSEV